MVAYLSQKPEHVMLLVLRRNKGWGLCLVSLPLVLNVGVNLVLQCKREENINNCSTWEQIRNNQNRILKWKCVGVCYQVDLTTIKLSFSADTFHRHTGTEQPHLKFKTQKVNTLFVLSFSWCQMKVGYMNLNIGVFFSHRPILMNGNGKKPKYIHQIYDDNVCVEQVGRTWWHCVTSIPFYK